MTRRELAYVVGTLRQKKRQIASIGFATDDPVLSRWETQAIEKAIGELERPRFLLSPFV